MKTTPKPLDRGAIARHLVDDVLAWWITNGPDDEYGGILTCWDNVGNQLVSHDKYTWSQGRWAWLTAQVARTAAAGTIDVGDTDQFVIQSVSTSTFVRDHALLAGSRVAYRTDRAGKPLPDDKGQFATSVFADLFSALGFAGTARVDPDGGWQDLADKVLAQAAALIASGAAPTEPYPVPLGHRSLAMPMMLVGIGEQVHRATGSSESAAVVAHAAQEISDHHIRGHDVVEMPTEDPARQHTLIARHRTPGHILELVWFALHARDLIANTALGDIDVLTDLALEACRRGWDEDHGGLFRYVDLGGGTPRGSRQGDDYETLVQRTWDTKLWWPHAEAFYGLAAMGSATGSQEIATWLQRLSHYTFDLFPEGPGREWTQIRARDGQPLEEVVALPVKDPFHIARALLLTVELLDRDSVPGD